MELCQICNEPVESGWLCSHCESVGNPDWADTVIDAFNRTRDQLLAQKQKADVNDSLSRAADFLAGGIAALDGCISIVRAAAIRERKERLLRVVSK